jgi:hypothetical protein
MSGEDQSTNVYPQPAIDTTGLAVAIGRIEANQANTATTLGEIKLSVGGVAETVASHSTMLASLTTKVEQHDELFAQARPVKNGWPVVVGTIVGIGGTVFGVCALAFHW